MIAIVIAATLWGLIGPLTHLVIFPAWIYAAFRLMVPTLFLYVYFAVQKRDWKWPRFNKSMILLSGLNVFRIGFYFLALSLAPVSHVIFFLYLWPIITIVLNAWHIKKGIRTSTVIAGIVAITGLILVQIPYGISLTSKALQGGLLMLVVAIISAVSIVIIKDQSNRYSPMETVFYQNSFGGVIAIVTLSFLKPTLSVPDLSFLTLFALIIGVFTFFLYYRALKKTDTAIAMILSYTELFVSATAGVLILKEPLTLPSFLGGLLIFIVVIGLPIYRITKKS